MKTLFLDTETKGIQHLYNLQPKEQFHLGQWAWGRSGEVHTTPDYDTFMHEVSKADLLIGHNLFYDTRVMYGKESTRPLELALNKRILDTFSWYPLRFRVPNMYTNRAGRKATTLQQGKQKPELIKKFLALDNLTHYHGLPGKSGDLVALAKEFNPEGTLKENLDFKLIPNDEPRFLEYAVQDIVALQALASFMLDEGGKITDYEWREMAVTGINDQISANGFTVDLGKAQARVEELAIEKDETMSWLVENFAFPTEGKQPWRSGPGKAAIFKVLESFGVTEKTRPDWERTATGNLSLGGQVMIELTEGLSVEAEKFGRSLATLMGQRSLAQLALDSVWEDGKAHPEITALQRSGRFSVTKPSLPIWTARGKGAVEKEYFIASPGCKLVEQDFSNADQRIVAALGGDHNYAKRFEPGVDGHEVSGRLMFGDEVYDSDPEGYRNIAKALSHAFAYGAGAKTLAKTSELPESEDPERDPLRLAYRFIDAMNSEYPFNKIWRESAYKEGKTGWITNSWGRRMPVDVERAFTQSSGLLGQSGTRDVLCDGLLDIANDKLEVITWLVATVHDAVIWDIPEGELEWAVPYIQSKLERTYDPKTPIGLPTFFPVSSGEPSNNWLESGH